MLYHSPHQHFKQHSYLKHKDLDALYGSYFIKLLGETLISVFTAIFLLSNGFTLTQVATYYIIYFISAFFAGFVARFTMQHAGVVKTLALGIIGYIAYYFLLQKITQGVPFELVATVYGLASGLYFSAFNIELARALNNSKAEGSAVAMIRIIAIAAGVVGPISGALFISQFSFALLFSIVAVILLISLVPLLFAGDYKLTLPSLSARRILAFGSHRRALVYTLNGAVGVGLDVLWPIFIYINFANYLAVGGIVSLTSLIMIVVIYWIGRYSDLHHARSYKIGILSHAPTWIIRLVLLTPGGLLASNLLSAITAYLFDIPLNKAVYHSANQANNTPDYFIFTAFYTTIGRVLLLTTAALLQNLIVIFALMSVLTFAHLLLMPELRNKPKQAER